ncbi:vacuolar protein sorting-associated protein 54-like isoform X2 [Macrosteles quadrilineatus]|uniref:vacuolar protein sorting-associated protein 54-like isoform X2 n=1 Tax=Macrosteles quadrilineatus TaxID=74068 RepID=UPI0023E22F5D|nr:vacuolar protein sorting-associated protein 54-like isoform X2 [Macrosteles quadrilineatus]
MEDVKRDPPFSNKLYNCERCSNASFSSLQLFVEHLRAKHCSQEGGSFVCRYGDNDVCSSLPVEGVNDLDYERHVLKHHATHGKSHSRKSSTRSEVSGERWTLHTTAQNLPAVLNDPKQGKQKDFFTKTWGDSFVEVADIPDPRYLPHITLENFQAYLKKTVKRHRKHARLSSVALKPHSHAELLQTFPNLRVSPKSIEKNQFDISVIPKIFLDSNFTLNNVETFNTVFPHLGQLRVLPQSSSPPPPSDSAKILQEKLTHYLDIVEVQIAQQVSQKSDAFFLAMTSHDTLMEQLGHTISMVRTLREKINSIDSVLVKDSLTLIKCERTRKNYLQVYNKLKLMSTVLQTQPTIQLLLSAPDYVAALDLIFTTQELLSQHLAGVHSFRHLGSELNEMVKVIGTLMTGEFERYATADLNRPLLESEDQVLQGDKLSCIVLGMLRRGCFDFIDAYQQETVSAIKAAVKQAVIEVVATSELAHRVSGDASLDDQLKALATEEWTQLLKNAATTLRRLVRRVKKAAEIMQHAADASAGISAGQNSEEATNSMPVTDYFLTAADHAKVSHKLKQLLSSTCQYTQERCAQLLSSKSLIWPDEKCPTITTERDKENNSSKSSHWLAEKATLTQLSELYQHVELLSCECENVCPEAPASYLRSAFRSQANRFMQRFHFERTTKLSLILDSESWKQTEVPVEFQQLLDQISETGKFSQTRDQTEEILDRNRKPANFLFVEGEKFAVVGTVLILVNIVAEYCVRAEDMSLSAANLLGYLAELLALFNSRSFKLVLGAEAVSEKTGLKKITTANLALVLRALQLLLWLIPHIRLHFQSLLPESAKMTQLETVTRHIKTHVRDVQDKLVSIMEPLVVNELKHWEARPPVPSKSFQNICKRLMKLHEAIANILPENQTQDLYRTINCAFKDTLRDQLARMNIVNNGGPQHGLVTQELTFYLEDLKRIKVLPEEELCIEAMSDIWQPKYR